MDKESLMHFDENSVRKIIHVDMDAFFASVEELDFPQYAKKPLAVGGDPNQRGIVASASYSARKFGVKSAMSMKQALKLCPDLIVRPCRFERYREISNRVLDILLNYTDRVESVSIDEAYLDITENFLNISSATLLAKMILKNIYEELGLTASAGVSFNKFLAKIASDYQKPSGLTVIPPSEAIAFLDRLPVEKFYGVGKVTTVKMHSKGIFTGRDLRQYDLYDLVSYFGKMGMIYHEMARGYDPRPVETIKIRKSFGAEKTFPQDVLNFELIKEEFERLAERIELLLVKYSFMAKTLTVKIRYTHTNTVSRALSFPLFFWRRNEVIDHLFEILKDKQLFQSPVRCIGLSVSNLQPITPQNSGGLEGNQQLLLPF